MNKGKVATLLLITGATIGILSIIFNSDFIWLGTMCNLTSVLLFKLAIRDMKK